MLSDSPGEIRSGVFTWFTPGPLITRLCEALPLFFAVNLKVPGLKVVLDKAMWNSVSVAVTVVAPPAAAADPGGLEDGDDAGADEPAAGVVADGELAAVDEPEEQAASRLTAAAATGIANQVKRRRCRRPLVFMVISDEDMTSSRWPQAP
jgi:hypothetical protein